jgi:transposase
MIAPPPNVRVWLACGRTDMRKGFDGLASLTEQQLGHDPFSGQLFVFRGKRGQQATFSIRFSYCQDRLSLAPAIWADVTGIVPPTREGLAMHLHGRAARP